MFHGLSFKSVTAANNRMESDPTLVGPGPAMGHGMPSISDSMHAWQLEDEIWEFLEFLGLCGYGGQ